MVTPTAGEIILVPFPFSDLSQSKLRPAVCLADAGRGDWVLCQITSSPYGDPAAVLLDASDFASGGLLMASFARPGKLFTAHAGLIVRDVEFTERIGGWRPCDHQAKCLKKHRPRGRPALTAPASSAPRPPRERVHPQSGRQDDGSRRLRLDRLSGRWPSPQSAHLLPLHT